MTSNTISWTSTRSFICHTVYHMLWRFRSLALVLLAYGAACDSVDLTTTVPKEQFNQVYWSLELNHHAILLSTEVPWNTMQLEAIPLTYERGALSTDGATISYVSADTNAVSVTPDGMVRAKTATGAGTVRVIVRLTLGTITHADTALVKVQNNPAPPTLQSFSIQPGQDDSAKVDQSDSYGIGLDLSRFLDRPDQNGRQMTEIIVYYRSLDEHVTKVDRETGVVSLFSSQGPRRVGDARVIATVYAYGVSFTDTLLVTIGYPLGTTLFFEDGTLLSDGQVRDIYIAEGGTRTLGVGSYIEIGNFTSQQVNLRFEDATGILQSAFESVPCAVGLLPNLIFLPFVDDRNNPNDFPCVEYLSFSQPGTYRFQDVQNGLSGVITVVDESRPSP